MRKLKHLWWGFFPLTLSLLLGIMSIFVFAEPAAQTPSPTVSIDKFNLSFEDAVYIKYAVRLDGVDANALGSENFRVLFWTAPQESYDVNTAQSSASTDGYQAIDGVTYYIFKYTNLSAKQMTDDIYARAYINVDGNAYYSDVEKYSILQYVYNKLGKTGTATTNENLKTLLSDMLSYGASAQTYFNYKTDRLATSEFYQINVTGGALPDGSTSGLYLAGETVTITAPETNENGVAFSHWANATGTAVGEELSHTVTVDEKNATYTAVYAESVVSQGLTFASKNDGTCYVSGIGTCEDTDVVIPSISPIGDHVTGIGRSAFYNCASITSITIPNSVTSIGDSAFYGCTNLETISLPLVGARGFGYIFGAPNFYYNDDYLPVSLKTVKITGGTSINEYEFAYCSNLTSIEIPNSVTSIEGSAFLACTSLEKITVHESNTNYFSVDGILYSKLTPQIIKVPSKISGYVSIPNDIISIKDSAFYGCTELTGITIPESVTNIGDSAFYGCTNLANIVIPESVTNIGDSAFYGCTNLANIVIPESVTSIGFATFSGCSSLESIVLPFVGDSVKAKTDTYQYPFGYIFGTNEYTSGVATRQSYHGNSTSDIISQTFYIPASLKSVVITGGNILHGMFENCKNLTSITIPNNVTNIGQYAFSDCTSLTSITIPNSVTNIDQYAFSDCTSLTSVTIGNNVTNIDQYAFKNCKSLTSITIPNSVTNIDQYTFRDCCALTSVTIPDSVTNIGNAAFEGCTKLTNIALPDGITNIGDYTFEGCASLTSITIPNSVTSIGRSAFSGCTNLASVTIPDSVTSIGKYAFCTCSNLTNIKIGNNVTSLDSSVFENCKNITIATIPATVIPNIPSSALQKIVIISGTSIDDNAFDNHSNLISVTIPDSVTSIGKYAFRDCCALTSVTIPDSVTNIGNAAFEGCTSLTSITLSNGITNISDSAFEGCTSLTSITIPNGITNIGDATFKGCESLTSITIPDGVTNIGDAAFEGCTSLTSITIPDSITVIGSSAFSRCSKLIYNGYNNAYYLGNSNNPYVVLKTATSPDITSCEIHESTKIIYHAAFYNCRYLTSITIPNNVATIGNSAFELPSFSTGTNVSRLKSITIGNSVTSIGHSAFCGSFALTSIIIPDSVTSIGVGAFAGCNNLTNVIIGDNVTSISDRMFQGCYRLTNVTIGDNVTSIGEWAFRDCTNLSNITIPDSVTNIGNETFYDCKNLSSIIIGNNVTNIGSYAFANCANLQVVYYYGVASEWNQISINGTSNSNLVSAPRYYYSESEPTESGNYWYYDENGEPAIWTLTKTE